MRTQTLLPFPWYGPKWTVPFPNEEVSSVTEGGGVVIVVSEIVSECSVGTKTYHITHECCNLDATITVVTRLGKKRYTHTFLRDDINPNIIRPVERSDDPCFPTARDITPALQAFSSMGISSLEYTTSCLLPVPPLCGEGEFQAAVTPTEVWSRISTEPISTLIPTAYGAIRIVSDTLLEARYINIPYRSTLLPPCDDTDSVLPLSQLPGRYANNLEYRIFQGRWLRLSQCIGGQFSLGSYAYLEEELGSFVGQLEDLSNPLKWNFIGNLSYSPAFYPSTPASCGGTDIVFPTSSTWDPFSLTYAGGLGLPTDNGGNRTVPPLYQGIIADTVGLWDEPLDFRGNIVTGIRYARTVDLRIRNYECRTPEDAENGTCDEYYTPVMQGNLQDFAPPEESLEPLPPNECRFRITLSFIGSVTIALPIDGKRYSLEFAQPLGDVNFTVPGPCGVPPSVASYVLGTGANVVIDTALGAVTKLLPPPYSWVLSTLDLDVDVTIEPA